MFNVSVGTEVQFFVDRELNIEDISYSSSNNQIIYASAGLSPENIFVDLVGFITLAFGAGFVNKAGADAWNKLKGRLEAIRERHRGGLELEFLESEGEGLVRYVIPEDPVEAKVAIDAIESDLGSLRESDERERWWLGRPESKWATGLESIQHRNHKRE